MTLHKVWENTFSGCKVFYEVFDINYETAPTIKEYDGKERFTIGSQEVCNIRAIYLPEVGNVIMCVL